jgi:hypothetical protein
MPLDKSIRDNILEYCNRHLANEQWFEAEFDFIHDTRLVNRLALEFYSARYIYKLGEALAAENKQLHSHLKFQIMQYASIYEAIIVHLLWQRFAEHDAVKRICKHPVFKPEGKLPKNIRLTTRQSEELYICALREAEHSPHSIKFDDKIGAAIEIGFLHPTLGKEIGDFYKLRNAIHIETAVKRQVEYEMTQAQLAYRRMRPFIKGIRTFLETGAKPKLG